jgi:hypothetical protein
VIVHGYRQMLTYVCSLIANASFDRVRENHEAGTWPGLRLAELHRLILEEGDCAEFSFRSHVMSESSKITARNFYWFACWVAALEAEIDRFNVVCAVGGHKQGKSTVLGDLFNSGVRASLNPFEATEPLVVTVRQPDKNAHRRKCDVVIDLPAAPANDHLYRVILESAAVVLVVHGCDRGSGDSDAFPIGALSHARGAQIFVFITKADVAFLDAAQGAADRGFEVALFSMRDHRGIEKLAFRWRDAVLVADFDTDAHVLRLLQQHPVHVNHDNTAARVAGDAGREMGFTRYQGAVSEAPCQSEPARTVLVTEDKAPLKTTRLVPLSATKLRPRTEADNRWAEDPDAALRQGLQRGLNRALWLNRALLQAASAETPIHRPFMDGFIAELAWNEVLQRADNVKSWLHAIPELHDLPPVNFQVVMLSRGIPAGRYRACVARDGPALFDAHRAHLRLQPDCASDSAKKHFSEHTEM